MRAPVALLLLLAPLLPFGAAQADDFEISNRDVAALIHALQQSAQTPGPDRITLAAGGIYTLELTDSAGLALPPLRGDVQIDGNGAEIRRYAATRMYLMEVAAGATAVISSLTLAEGSLGALRNHGTLTLDHVAITDSFNEDAEAIVLNFGALTLRDSLIGYNQIHGIDDASGLIENHGRLDMQRSRIVGNSVSRKSQAVKGAAAVVNEGELTADATEFSANDISDPFGGLTFSAVLNLGSGTAHGLLPQTLIADVIDPR